MQSGRTFYAIIDFFFFFVLKERRCLFNNLNKYFYLVTFGPDMNFSKPMVLLLGTVIF